ncbi:MAG: inositol 2-dehydrogenase [Paenibacillaceae bacterium ZCTH02-B3]|nr:MAG: inositol 2-dehydrogenase [Paenibacillaceae bacterium ZCTH02-B3]
MSDQVRCAVIGLGRLGFRHAQILQTKIKSARLVKVATSRRESAEKAARELGGVAWTADPREIFEDPDIDAVLINTPTDTHAQYLVEAARHGKHIYVEKPVTKTLEEARRVYPIVRDSGVLCQVGFMRRFDPAYAEAKKRIEAGDIGKPIYFKGVSRDPASPPEAYIRTSGGIFLDLAIHDFDIARYLMGSEVKTVRSVGSIQLHTFMADCGDVDQALTYLTFESGAAGDVESSRNAGYGYDIRGEVVGTEGTLLIGSLRQRDLVFLSRNGRTTDIVPDFVRRFDEAFTLELEHFIECVRRRETPLCTMVDGIRALEIAEAATESFRRGQEMEVGKEKV